MTRERAELNGLPRRCATKVERDEPAWTTSMKSSEGACLDEARRSRAEGACLDEARRSRAEGACLDEARRSRAKLVPEEGVEPTTEGHGILSARGLRTLSKSLDFTRVIRSRCLLALDGFWWSSDRVRAQQRHTDGAPLIRNGDRTCIAGGRKFDRIRVASIERIRPSDRTPGTRP